MKSLDAQPSKCLASCYGRDSRHARHPGQAARGLLRRLDSLRAASPEARRGPTWAHEVRAFLADLAGHEERETDLLTRTLDGSTSAAD